MKREMADSLDGDPSALPFFRRLPDEGDGPKDASPISQSRPDDALVDSFENDGQADQAKT